jgi:hypothetical protein
MIAGLAMAGATSVRAEANSTTMIHAMHAIADIELSLSMPLLSAPGAATRVALAVANRGKVPVSYWRSEPMFNVAVIDSEGKPVGRTDAGERELDTPMSGSIRLPAGHSKNATYDLARWFILRRKGGYKLTASISFDIEENARWGTLIINDMAFYVGEIPAPEEPR